MQFPASNDEKNYIYEKIDISNIELLDYQASTKNNSKKFCDISIDLKPYIYGSIPQCI